MRRTPLFSHALILCAALMLLCGLPAMAAESPIEETTVELEAPVDQQAETRDSADAFETAAWGGPEAPLVTAVKAEFESGSDCDSSQGYCTSSAQCRNFCRALTGEIGFCNQIYNCCVCPELPF